MRREFEVSGGSHDALRWHFEIDRRFQFMVLVPSE